MKSSNAVLVSPNLDAIIPKIVRIDESDDYFNQDKDFKNPNKLKKNKDKPKKKDKVVKDKKVEKEKTPEEVEKERIKAEEKRRIETKEAEINAIQYIAKKEMLKKKLVKLDPGKVKDARLIASINIELNHIDSELSTLKIKYGIDPTLNNGSRVSRFFDKIKRKGKKIWRRIKRFCKNNKNLVYGLASIILPAIGSLLVSRISRKE